MWLRLIHKAFMKIACCLTLWIACAALAQTNDRSEQALAVNMAVYPLDIPRRLQAAVVQVPQTPIASKTVQVHVRVMNAAHENWTLIVENLAGAPQETIPARDFFQGEYWTNEYTGGAVRLRIAGPDPMPDVRVDKYAVEVEYAQSQGRIGVADESKPLSDLTVPARARALSNAIARLKVQTARGPRNCSGFLLGADLLMTNYHCISTLGDAAGARVEFGIETPTIALFRVAKIEASDRQLDYALVRLSAAAAQFGRLFIGAPAGSPTRLILIQYPGGKFKTVAFPPNCAVGVALLKGVDDRLHDFGHTCDTAGGSSGSPVVRWEDGSVVGLHHWNYDPASPGSLNQAVHMGHIVKDLTDKVTAMKVPRAVLVEVTKPVPQG